MRRSFIRRFAVLLLLFSMVVPASAAPRRDDGSPNRGSFLERVIQLIKHVVAPLEDIKPNFPNP